MKVAICSDDKQRNYREYLNRDIFEMRHSEPQKQ